MTLCQASWFSQMSCETLFYSWFDHSDLSMGHLLRLLEFLLDLFGGLRFVTTRHTGAIFPSSFPHSLAFKATIMSLVWHSKSLFLCISGFQSHHLSTSWHSEPLFTVWRSEPLVSLAFRATIFLRFDIQSHYIFSLTIKVVSSVRHSKSLDNLAFRAIISCLGFGTITPFSNFEGMWGPSSMTSHKSRLIDWRNQVILVFQ